MREAVGGSLILYFIIPIIVVFIFFIGFVIKYAATFRAANYLVGQMEECDKSNSISCSLSTGNLGSEYHYTGKVDCSCSSNIRGYVCGVTLYVSMEIPLLGEYNLFSIKSETRTLGNINSPVC